MSLSHGNPPSSFPQAHQEFLLPFLSTRFLLLMMLSSQRWPGTRLLAVEQAGFVAQHSGREPWVERGHGPRDRALRTALCDSVTSRVWLSAAPWTAAPGSSLPRVCSLSRVRLSAAPWTAAPGSSVHGISQARTLGWVALSSFRGSLPDPMIEQVVDSLPLSHQGSPGAAQGPHQIHTLKLSPSASQM